MIRQPELDAIRHRVNQAEQSLAALYTLGFGKSARAIGDALADLQTFIRRGQAELNARDARNGR